MDEHQLRTALATHPLTRHIFRDVVAANHLPSPAHQRGVYVVNTHPHDLPGEHWVALHYTPRSLTYFDSYGLPTHPRILRHLRHTDALRGRKLFYHGTRLQGVRQTCGLYCIYYVLTLCIDNHTMDMFNTDLDANDRIVHTLVRRMFLLNKPI